jgi:ABC-type glycerol-3-phosphate transport system substrate-binding protein
MMDGPSTPPNPAARKAHSAALSRRQFLKLTGATVAGAALSACNLAKPPTARSGEKAQLVYQDWRTDWFPPMAQQLLEQFHASHPNIRVFYTPDPEDLEGKMLDDMQAGTAPDVFQGCCSFFPIWAQKGYALDLRPYVKADLDRATLEDWDPAQYNALFTRDGRQYGLPKYHGALALYYNKDVFDQYKVDYPNSNWSYQDYLAAMKRLTHRDPSGKTDLWGSMFDVSWDRIQVYVNSWGGHFVSPQDPARSLMAEPPALEALEWLRARLWDDKVMPTALDVQKIGTRQAFIAGQLAMVEDGSWALKDILNGSKFRVGVAPFPAGPARRATLATTDGFAIYAGTRHPEAAWELLKFLISKDCGRAMAKAHFLQPARASLVEDWVSYIRAEYPEKAREMDLNAFADGHLKGYSVVAEVFANMAEAQKLANDAWEKILTLGQSPVELMKTVSQQIEAAQPRSG